MRFPTVVFAALSSLALGVLGCPEGTTGFDAALGDGPSSDAGDADLGGADAVDDAGGLDSGLPPAVRTVLTSSVGYRYTNPRFSPDGQGLAVLAWDGATLLDVFLLELDGTVRAELGIGGAVRGLATNLAFSPDGDTLYFADASGNGISAFSTLTSSVVRITSAQNALEPDVSPDGQTLVYRSNTRLRRTDIATGDDQEIVLGEGVGASYARFSPDGSGLSFFMNARLRVWSVGDQSVRDVAVLIGAPQIDWIDDGSFALATDRGIETVHDVEPSEAPRLVFPEPTARQIDVSPDGRTIAYTTASEPSVFLLRGF